MTIDNALTPIVLAQKMLAEAVSFEDFRAIRDTAEAYRAWARARNLGLGAENTAAEYVLRAERGMGKVLDEMSATGARRARGSNQHRATGDDAPGLPELGITMKQAHLWRRLASSWTDSQFEEHVAEVRSVGARMAKVDFYRGPRQAQTRDTQAIREGTEPEPITGLVATFRVAASNLMAGMSGLPADELVLVAAMLRELVAIYTTTREQRS